MKAHTRTGFTLVDVCAIAATLPAVLAVAAAAIGRAQPAGADPASPDPDPAAKAAALRAKDVSHLRAIMQGHVVWSQSHADHYALPSLVDVDNHTVRGAPAEKDTTANIQSLLVFHEFFPAEMLVSPAESNSAIVADKDYQLQDPAAAAHPERALWDPALAADFTAGEANISYASLQPSGGRAARWASTFVTDEPVLGNRGPQIEAAAKQPDGTVALTFANPQSNALRIHGDGTSWSGHLVYNDASVHYHQNMLRPGEAFAAATPRRFLGSQAKDWPDVWCYDEADDGESKNDFLGIFVTAGSRPELFKAIWD